jgi:stage II sporulation protein AA (anti-sigma F factor antagonist)
MASVTTETIAGAVVVHLAGEIDLENAAVIQAAIDAAISNHEMDAVVDLSEITYIDSVGMRYLFTLAGRLNTAQIRFRLVAPEGTPARRVVELSGLAAVAPVDPPIS